MYVVQLLEFLWECLYHVCWYLYLQLKDKGSTFVNVDKNKKSGAEKVLKIEIQKLQR